MTNKPFLILCLALLGLLCACGPAAAAQPPAQVGSIGTDSAPTGSFPAGTDSAAPQSAQPAGPVTLNVFAAASLTEAFGEIGEAFAARNPGVRVVNNFAGSQQLIQQLSAGAPGDVFASANQKYMQAAVDAGRVDPQAPQDFARNRLVVIFPADNPAGLRSLEDLARPGLRLVLAAGQVPVGQYTLEFLEKAAGEAAYGPPYREAVIANVVSYEETVKAVLSKVVLGEADAGVVYTSDLSGKHTGQIEIPDDLNVIASYPIAEVKDGPHPALAQAFVEYVLSAEGQAVLARYGFIPVDP